MSVVVMGMEMPKTCNDCLICCEHSMLYKAIDDKRSPKCPLRPLPEKHGRLIDGDKLANGCDDPHWCRWLSEIENMPTIVEAEGE